MTPFQLCQIINVVCVVRTIATANGKPRPIGVYKTYPTEIINVIPVLI